MFSPTVLSNGATANISAITTTNISRVTLAYSGNVIALDRIAPDKWQASFAFVAPGLLTGAPNANLILTASRVDGAAATIQIPVSVNP